MPGLELKHVLKRTMRGLLPDAVLRKRKGGFNVPMSAWLKHQLRPLVDEYLSPARVRRDGFFRPETTSRLVVEHMAGRADYSRNLWRFCSSECGSSRHGPLERARRRRLSSRADTILATCGPATRVIADERGRRRLSRHRPVPGRRSRRRFRRRSRSSPWRRDRRPAPAEGTEGRRVSTRIALATGRRSGPDHRDRHDRRRRRQLGALAPRVSGLGSGRHPQLAPRARGTDRALASLFDFRFGGDNEIAGHSLGNLILAALTHLEGDLVSAVDRAGELLGIRGRVVPSTIEDVTLSAEFVDGSCIDGESRIARCAGRFDRFVCDPRRRRPRRSRARPRGRRPGRDRAGQPLHEPDPVLLVRELAQTLARSRARVVLVMNLMSEPGETDGYGAVDCLTAIRRHAPEVPIHDVLLNTAPIPRDSLARYAAEGAQPIRVDVETLHALGCRPIERDVLGTARKSVTIHESWPGPSWSWPPR